MLMIAILYPAVVFGLGSLFILPNLFHIFEFRASTEVDLKGLDRHVGSSDIKLAARPLRDRVVTDTTQFLPLVGKDWIPGQPVPAILMGKGNDFDLAAQALEGGGAVDLELHEVLWEGTPSAVKDEFSKQGFDVVSAVTVTPPGSTPKFTFVMLLIFTASAAGGATVIAGGEPREKRPSTPSV